MAIWKEQTTPRKDDLPMPADLTPKKEPETRPELATSYTQPRRPTEREMKESLIAAELTIEGKIEGTGPVRIAGRFSGDVHVQGNLTIEAGAKLIGGVKAHTVIIGGELEGNISDATRVELLETGVLSGDVKAGSLTVAAGSRMRGKVEFGWEEKAAERTPHKTGLKMEGGSAA